jgi:hypothetical protein
MKKNFNYLRKDKLIMRLYLLSFVFLAITFAFVIFSYSKLPPLLPILNQFPWGEKRLTATPGILVPPLIALGYLVFNIILSAISYERYPLLGRIFAVTTSLATLLTLLFVIRTITLII